MRSIESGFGTEEVFLDAKGGLLFADKDNNKDDMGVPVLKN